MSYIIRDFLEYILALKFCWQTFITEIDEIFYLNIEGEKVKKAMLLVRLVRF